MSYLIALYVYYHGNNLSMFGVDKGVKEEDLNNTGMKHASEINPDLVDKKLIEDVTKQELKEKMTKKEMEWETMMKNAIKQSQQETFKLSQSDLLDDTVFDHTPKSVIEEFDDTGNIPLDFFSEMNGSGFMEQNQHNENSYSLTNPWI